MVEHQPSKLDTWVRFPSPAFFIPIYGYEAFAEQMGGGAAKVGDCTLLSSYPFMGMKHLRSKWAVCSLLCIQINTGQIPTKSHCKEPDDHDDGSTDPHGWNAAQGP